MSLIGYLPEFYQSHIETIDLQLAFEVAVSDLQEARDDFMAQLDIETATWGLDLWWEPMYGIQTDIEKPYEYRRSRIISKMRGAGTTTKELVKNVAESFSNGEVEVIEYPGEYRFEVKFVGTLGIPPNMGDLTDAIDEIKPAHLAYTYVIIYRTHGELKVKTHIQLSAYTHETLKGGDIV